MRHGFPYGVGTGEYASGLTVVEKEPTRHRGNRTAICLGRIGTQLRLKLVDADALTIEFLRLHVPEQCFGLVADSQIAFIVEERQIICRRISPGLKCFRVPMDCFCTVQVDAIAVMIQKSEIAHRLHVIRLSEFFETSHGDVEVMGWRSLVSR